MDNINDYINEGNNRMAKADYSTATEFFQVALEIDPENEEALLAIASAYKMQGNIVKAKKSLYRVLSNNPEHTMALQGIEELVSNSNNYVANSNSSMGRDPDCDFRVAKWGETKEAIMKKEGETNLVPNNPDIYAFNGNIAGMKCLVAYFFTNNQLTMAKYIFEEEHSNSNLHIDDYTQLVRLMTEKYGKPIEGGENNMVWFNDLYRDNFEDWGFAISMGHMAMDATWETAKSDILVQLSGENYEIKLIVQYIGREFKEKRQEKSKEDNMKWL